MLSNLIFNLQRSIFSHSLVKTLLPPSGEREGEVAVRSLGEGGHHREPFRHKSHKHGQDTKKETETFQV